jgi:hypothetical protein
MLKADFLRQLRESDDERPFEEGDIVAPAIVCRRLADALEPVWPEPEPLRVAAAASALRPRRGAGSSPAMWDGELDVWLALDPALLRLRAHHSRVARAAPEWLIAVTVHSLESLRGYGFTHLCFTPRPYRVIVSLRFDGEAHDVNTLERRGLALARHLDRRLGDPAR